MLQLLILSAAIAALCCALLIRSGARIAARYSMDLPQRFHAGHVPRLGGIGMLAGFVAGLLWMLSAMHWFGQPIGVSLSPGDALAWFLPAAVAAGGGAAEDIWHRLRARWRLLATGLAALLGVWLLGLRVETLGLAWIDALWGLSPWPAVLLALLAVAGLPHAFNLIDGYNGLAGTVALVCCMALAYVSLQVGDRQLAAVMVVLAGSTAGFLFWNYPRGLIFAGDGGAYLWGAVIAISAITLVQRHAQVSPWFPMLLLIYPVLETLFSIYRKVARGDSPGLADALHFHQLIYRRIVREAFHDDGARKALMRNNRTSPYLWGFTVLTVVPAVLFWRNSLVLASFCALSVATYVWAYLSIVRFRVPRWMRR